MHVFFRNRLLAPPQDEVRLLHEVRRAYPDLDFYALTREVLARIAGERGIDFATALLYDRVRRSPEHGPFIAGIERLEPDLDRLPRLSGKVLVVPAGFYQEYPELGGDGRLACRIAGEFGLESRVLPLESRGSVRDNAAVIRREMAAEREGPAIVISLSKGSADFRLALAEGGPEFRTVRAWVQICGVVRGSPLVDMKLGGGMWHQAVARGSMACLGVRFGVLRELAHGPGSLLAAPVEVPTGVEVISVVGFPLTSHLTGRTRARHQRLAHLGPNDGTTLLRDAVLEPGLVYPVWGGDHYFRVPEVSRLLYRLFLYLGKAGILPQSGTADPDPTLTPTPILTLLGRE
jgi:hypothetical protein